MAISGARDSTQRAAPPSCPIFLIPQPASQSVPPSVPAPQPCLLPGGPAELLVTEAAHVRMLRVLHDLFYQPMAEGGFFLLEELQNIFPSLEELIEVHCECRAAALLHSPHAHPGAQCGLPKRLPWAACSSTPPQNPRAHIQGARPCRQKPQGRGRWEGGRQAHQPQGSDTPPPAPSQLCIQSHRPRQSTCFLVRSPQPCSWIA